jgi:hypothetical protein
VGFKTQLFSSKRFLTKFLMFLFKNGISPNAKQCHEVDLDSWGQNKTFFFQTVFDVGAPGGLVFCNISHFYWSYPVTQKGEKSAK